MRRFLSFLLLIVTPAASFSFAQERPDRPGPPVASAEASPKPTPTPGDPRAEELAQEDYEALRPHLLEDLSRLGRSRCVILGGYAASRNARVRENAVRAMLDTGCDEIAAFAPYFDDPDPWVSETILRAVEAHLMTGAVPYLLDRLGDRRTIVSDDGTWTIGETALRVLIVVTCQSFHYDPKRGPAGQQEAVDQWRRWFEEHRTEPRSLWVTAGLALARDYLRRAYAPHRLEGIRLLALIGPPALADLRAAFERSPGDLKARVACTPEEPPRVTDRVPCVLEVENVSTRRIPLAPKPDDPVVELRRDDAVSERGASRPAGRGTVSGAGKGAGAPEGSTRSALPAEIVSRMVDLAPGEVLRREFTIGPVPGAGHYEVRTRITDPLTSLPPVEAGTMVRFEQ
ncbi:MAG TPA: hypothetical protein VFT43_08185 [Candidatus Polarisedimenticolia bacterium]|nr:hypothetical protein [Candidatus Polarisedimenticolia bacterium]